MTTTKTATTGMYAIETCRRCRDVKFHYTGSYSDAKDLARRNGWFVSDGQPQELDHWFCARCTSRACNTFPALLEAAEKVVDFCIELNIEDSYPTLSGIPELVAAIAAARGEA